MSSCARGATPDGGCAGTAAASGREAGAGSDGWEGGGTVGWGGGVVGPGDGAGGGGLGGTRGGRSGTGAAAGRRGRHAGEEEHPESRRHRRSPSLLPAPRPPDRPG